MQATHPVTGSASLPYASGSEIACLDFEITIKENGSTSKYYEQKKAAFRSQESKGDTRSQRQGDPWELTAWGLQAGDKKSFVDKKTN